MLPNPFSDLNRNTALFAISEAVLGFLFTSFCNPLIPKKDIRGLGTGTSTRDILYIYYIVSPKAKADPQYYKTFSSLGYFMNLQARKAL